MTEFILKIKKGKTDCDDCPFSGGIIYHKDGGERICNMPLSIDAIIDCDKYDLNTMQVSHKIIKIKDSK
jgi:hypothetical protein